MRKIIKTTVALLTMLNIAAFAQQKGTFKDARDGKTYKTVKIGTQTWFAENLNYLDKADKDSKCYDDNPDNCTKYGRLYNWKTAMTACPKGWHLPSKEEWKTLVNFCGGSETAGTKLKAASGWENFNEKSGNGTDNYGFSAMPSGRFYNKFAHVGNHGYWWSAYEYADGSDAYYQYMSYNSEDVDGDGVSKLIANSVRCLQDLSIAEIKAAKAKADAEEKARLKAEADAKAKAEKEEKARLKAEADAKAKAEKEEKAKAEAYIKANSGTFTDARDKKVYKTIKIGSQTWFAENLNYADNASKCYDNKDDNCKKYGRLYDWETAMKVCPSGWHLPTKAELDILNNVGGGDSIAGNALKANSGWDKYKDENGSGTNLFGFAALPGGQEGYGKSFEYVGTRSSLWSAQEHDNDKYASYLAIYNSKNTQWFDFVAKTYMLSVRCLQGEAPPRPSKTTPPPAPAQQPASKPAEQPKQQSANENCSITFPKKACVAMPKGTCKLSGGKVVDKCP